MVFPDGILRVDVVVVRRSLVCGLWYVQRTASRTSLGDCTKGSRKIFVLAVQARLHNGKRSSCFFFSSANVRSLEMLRPNAIGLEFDSRFSIVRPIGLREPTRTNAGRPMRELFAWFFSSLSEMNDVVALLAERLRIEAGNLLRLRTVIVSGSSFFSDTSAWPLSWRISVYSLRVELSFDEIRWGGFGGLTGTNVCVCFGNGANKSIGLVTFVIG